MTTRAFRTEPNGRPRAVIAESIRRWGAPKSDTDRKTLEFLGS